MLRTSQHHGYDSGKKKIGRDFAGRGGTEGDDAPAIKKDLVVAEAKRLLNDAEFRRGIVEGIEVMDAAAMVTIHKAIAKVNEIIDSEPVKMADPINQAEAVVKHREMVVNAASKLFALANRLPKGNYAPTVIVDGKRFEVPMDPRDYCVLDGELHFRRSVMRIMDSTQQKGTCSQTLDGVCYYVHKTTELEYKQNQELAAQGDLTAPKVSDYEQPDD